MASIAGTHRIRPPAGPRSTVNSWGRIPLAEDAERLMNCRFRESPTAILASELGRQQKSRLGWISAGPVSGRDVQKLLGQTCLRMEANRILALCASVVLASRALLQ